MAWQTLKVQLCLQLFCCKELTIKTFQRGTRLFCGKKLAQCSKILKVKFEIFKFLIFKGNTVPLLRDLISFCSNQDKFMA